MSKRKYQCRGSSKGSLAGLINSKIGRVGTFYMTYRNNSEWNAKIFRGKVKAGRKNYFVIQDPLTKKLYVLFYRNLDYITFD